MRHSVFYSYDIFMRHSVYYSYDIFMRHSAYYSYDIFMRRLSVYYTYWVIYSRDTLYIILMISDEVYFVGKLFRKWCKYLSNLILDTKKIYWLLSNFVAHTSPGRDTWDLRANIEELQLWAKGSDFFYIGILQNFLIIYLCLKDW